MSDKKSKLFSKSKVMRGRLIFLEEILGTASADPKLHEEFIASQAPDAPSREEEIEALGVDKVVEKGKTIFSRDEEGNIILWDYQLKGFMKDACGALRRVKGTESSGVANYKKIIDGLIFPKPRKIVIHTDGKIGSCQRPLRGNTPKGETIAIAHSETLPAGSYIDFEILLFDEKLEDLVKELFEYGAFRGIGQWRNSGKGRFEVQWQEGGGK